MDKKYFRKRFSQNFLNDKNIIKKIVDKSNIEGKNIIEIGPGKGALTNELLKVVKKLTCYEIDVNLFDYLKKNIENEKFYIFNKDFLKVDLEEEVDIVANIPYNITTDILFKIIENYKLINSATLMVQKEVAERLVAKVNSSNYSKLTISVSYFYEVEILFDVPKESFYPIPKVTSSIIKLERKKNIDSYIIEKKFLNFIKQCFSYRRKTLINNLKEQYSQKSIIEFLNSKNYNHNSRPQELTLDDFLQLFEIIN